LSTIYLPTFALQINSEKITFLKLLIPFQIRPKNQSFKKYVKVISKKIHLQIIANQTCNFEFCPFFFKDKNRCLKISHCKNAQMLLSAVVKLIFFSFQKNIPISGLFPFFPKF